MSEFLFLFLPITSSSQNLINHNEDHSMLTLSFPLYHFYAFVSSIVPFCALPVITCSVLL